MEEELFLLTIRPQPKFDEDGEVEEDTSTSIDQGETEHLVSKALDEHFRQWLQTGRSLQLHKSQHIEYLQQKLGYIPTSFEELDGSQTWLAYWIIHGLYLFNVSLTGVQKTDMIRLLNSCQPKDGGFGGGPYQLGHLATTYGAINCLCTLHCKEALSIVDRIALAKWMHTLRQPDGSFALHLGGEVDIRGAYCAVAIATLTHTSSEELFKGTAEWIAKCQCYDGGFGGRPGSESQGGYSFCAIATLTLLNRVELIDLQAILRWVAYRQMTIEGGFQGRCNKVVGSCYAFWVGAIFPMLEAALQVSEKSTVDGSLFHARAVQEFLLAGCQKHPHKQGHGSYHIGYNASTGGFVDKPGGNPDPYHTCFGLAGLAIAQKTEVAGSSANRLIEIDPAYNLGVDAVRMSKEFYYDEKAT